MNLNSTLRAVSPAYWLVILVSGTFLPVLLYTFGRLDDMAFAHWFARDFHSTMRDIFMAQGRPLHGLLLAGLLHPVNTFADLVWLRLLAVILSCLFALQIFAFLQKRGVTAKHAVAMAFLMVANPGIAAIVGWAICSTHILGYIGAFAIGQWLLSTAAWQSWQGLVRNGLLAVLMLFPVLCLYQPAAAFILLPVLFNWLLDERKREHRAKLWLAIASYLFALASYYVGLKLTVDVILQLNTQAERSALVSDIPGKLVFLFDEPLRLLALSWAYFANSGLRLTVTLAVASIAVGGALRLLIKERLQGLVDLTHVVAVLVLGLIALIVLEANYAPFRTLVFGYTLTAFLVSWICLLSLPRATTTILWSLVGITAFTGHYYIRSGIAQPFEREYLHYRHAFEQQTGDSLPTAVLWAIPDHFDLRGQINHRRIRFEFGTLSSGMEYVVPGMTWMLLNELHRIDSRQHPLWQQALRVETVPLRQDRQWQRIPPLLFIDGPKIFTGIPATSAAQPVAPWQHPELGTVENLYNGWMYSTWFGIFNQWVYPGVDHTVLGRVRLERIDDNSFRLHSADQGSVIISPQTFAKAQSEVPGTRK